MYRYVNVIASQRSGTVTYTYLKMRQRTKHVMTNEQHIKQLNKQGRKVHAVD